MSLGITTTELYGERMNVLFYSEEEKDDALKQHHQHGHTMRGLNPGRAF